MDNQLDALIDKILDGTGLMLSAEERTKLGEEVVKIVLGRTLNVLDQTFLTDEDAKNIETYARNHSPEETLKYIREELPEFTQIFTQQTELYINEFRELAKRLKSS
ncbi:hypothetical protein A2V68_00570 [candidate division Kazan bacterium RBG_13_50_9]|uniref:Uncharacterized protein n=1 Tax=candidate division Kazan bacterium RBG_13_50_9 TaxID=1798535 RepID=A0A1F4NSJ6_UNCK3|nr:MAG: hypothetical protein A2V68_00570 [candidate division Kazan bacterium RBG_13_50_9]